MSKLKTGTIKTNDEIEYIDEEYTLLFQIRNSKVNHLCMDQGIKENHTATLHPCHGWGPQVEIKKRCITLFYEHTQLVLFFSSSGMCSCVGWTESSEEAVVLSGQKCLCSTFCVSKPSVGQCHLLSPSVHSGQSLKHPQHLRVLWGASQLCL